MSSCSCASPEEVDISCLFETNSSNGSTLMDNLQQFGWSPVRLNLPKHTRLPEINEWKAKLIDIFQNIEPDASLIFRTMESGGTDVEPKQSIEIQRSSLIQHLLQDWQILLHSVAATIQSNIFPSLPLNTLLCEDSTHAMDLMRAFYYEMNEHSLGSSPHTDWGSWTVVWQDSVGGLETYCHECQAWKPVPARHSDMIHLVVHVGDVTSLAMAHSNTTHEWPSPLHRVVSPTSERRMSLVYFAYPPPDLSIEDISRRVSNTIATTTATTTRPIPYDRYYLLRDQSDPNSTKTSEDVFREIQSLPLGTVLERKWQQVQRSD